MNPKGKELSVLLTALWNLLLTFSKFRQALPVTELMVFQSHCGETGYYVCPGCAMTIEREFMSFCNHCGQKLDWSGYKKVKKIFPGQQTTLI